MRKSKSNPAKYARNYRKISQRRMTEYENVNEEQEIERLRSLLRNSERQLKQVEEPSSNIKCNKKRKRTTNLQADILENDELTSSNYDTTILSEDLLADNSYESLGDKNPLIVFPNKKKSQKDKKAKTTELTPQEIKEAKLLQKRTTRKLKQLETRAAQKQKRTALYKKLEESQKVQQATLQPLLLSSGRLSRKDTDTKKQTLKKILNKERAGLTLTKAEKELLYPQYEVEERSEGDQTTNVAKNDKNFTGSNIPAKLPTATESAPSVYMKTENAKSLENNETLDKEDQEFRSSADSEKQHNGILNNSSVNHETTDNTTGKVSSTSLPSSQSSSSGINFAAQMMASLSRLSNEAKTKQQMTADDKVEELNISVPLQKRYIPENPTILKTAATMGLEPSANSTNQRKVLQIKRPGNLETTRFDLPVSAMEFEIMDAIRNNDVTIICGETGSGKSTQVPAYLYEAGFTLCPRQPKTSFLIGITQPRRVAAVSTAKRVCYEMGHGDGQSILGSNGTGNLVAYRTRYESAGMGDQTQIRFMTDGILLKEIQSDLLLRRYSVIVLDESHERNLNTDVLIGLLSAALPLRKKAAEEDPSIVPLKLILMSATLRVEDFTKNEKLFPMGAPAVVKVPGRTHPVTIHHSKITELDDYETAAFRKICKIHRKLPHGGILVFLTGKAEIVRMVNRLRAAFNRNDKVKLQEPESFEDVGIASTGFDLQDIPREMDDEELDADEDIDASVYNDTDKSITKDIQTGPENENVPSNVCVLPLYSLLSAEEQAKVFAPVAEGHRLIVVATNIAETSITIPGISYVVDTGRQKCRNYNSGTGIASYDVMWISRASADQRAGRAGRTGPGHCYRLYSSSLYSRHMDPFALPEVLTRPLEDVVLAMKAMKISDVSEFPFPTPPDRSQIDEAVRLLASIGCVDLSKIEREGGDGKVTRLGQAVAKLPVGVRYGKMLLVAAQAGVLDYAIVIVAVLSEGNPFAHNAAMDNNEDIGVTEDQEVDMDDIDNNLLKEREAQKKKIRKWFHSGGDVLASMLAVGAYTFAGRGAGGATEELANRKFCEENGLNHAIMKRIQKMRSYIASIAKNRLGTAEGVAAKTGGFIYKMSPPKKLEEILLIQSIASGLLDHVAVLATPGSIMGDYPIDLRSAYIGCLSSSKEPLFLDRASTVYKRDYRQLPRWVCYDSIVRKTAKDGTPLAIMKNITPIIPQWIGEISRNTSLLVLGAPLSAPPPSYDPDQDTILCSVTTKFGSHGWEIPPTRRSMYELLQRPESKDSSDFLPDDSFRWFARFLFEGKVLGELADLEQFMTDSPALITRKTPSSKVTLLVSSLAREGIDNARALRKHWAENDDKFLFKNLKHWIKQEHRAEVKDIWISAVRRNIEKWKENH